MTRKLMLSFVVILTMLIAMMGSQAAVGAQSAEDDPAQLEAGQMIFEANCSTCHGVAGEGSSRGRPLTGIASQEPDRSVHIASVTNGRGSMPAFGERLDADEIDAAVSYVRLTFVQPAEEPQLAVTGPSTTTWLAGLGVLALMIGFTIMATGKRWATSA